MRAAVMTLLVLAVAGAASAAPERRMEPRILSIKPVGDAVAGQPLRVEIVVKDPLAAVNGVQVDFGDRAGSVKQSACRPGAAAMGAFKPGAGTTFAVAHRYLLPGDYDLSVTATSGDCVIGPLSSRRRLRLRVRAPRPSDVVLPTATAAQAGGCSGAYEVPSAATLAAARRATLCLVNAIRAAKGLGALRSHRRLRAAARAHARDMVARGYFAHESPSGVDLATRLRRARYRGTESAENIGAGSDLVASPMAMLIGWMESPPHRENLLERRYDEGGVGIAAGFPASGAGATYAMAFGRRR